MKKILVAAIMSLGLACGSAKVAPIASPPTQEVAKEVAPTPAVPVADTMVEYKGSTWSVSFPSSFKSVAEKTDDDGVQTKNDKDEAFSFKRQPTEDTTEEVSNAIVYSFLIKGKEAAFLGEGKVMNWDAKEILYAVGEDKVLAVIIFCTGSNAYAFSWFGGKTQDKVDTFKAVLATIKVSDVAVAKKPEIKKPTKK